MTASRTLLQVCIKATLLASVALATAHASEAEQSTRGPDVVIISGKDKVVYEFRQNGQLRMVRVVPKWGKPYYLVPVDPTKNGGDLERAEGAPLTVGQTLFEIAPLNRMVVEVAIPDDEVAHVDTQQTIDMRLDAYPDQVWQAAVEEVHPRSEIRDDQNVFIAEAELDNAEGRLRPGMKGRAKVETQRRPIGWILFHKPWEYASKKLSW